MWALQRDVTLAGCRQRPRWQRWGAVLLAGCWGAACAPADPPPPDLSSPPIAATYVGVASCAGCHAEEDARWRGSHHDLAMQEAAAETVLADFDDVVFRHQGTETRFFRRDEGFWLEAEGPDGDVGEYRVTHTFGVEPLQQYLVEIGSGRLQALDIAWDTRPAEEGGQRWFRLQPQLNTGPGDPLHWTGIAYNWNFMCAECHSTDFKKNYDAGTRSYSSTYEELNVACEACHGPGSAHVEWARREPRPADAGSYGLVVQFPRTADTAWPIDPDTGLAHRVPARRLQMEVETCARCHARRGKTAPYEVGSPVTDAYRIALLDEGLYHPDGQILDEVYVYGSFLQSRMYQQGVSCSDCHDPHSLELYNGGNALCARCHLAARFDTPQHTGHVAGTDQASCVACHMPATTYMEVDPRRDHSFRVPRPDLTIGNPAVPNACNRCHTDQTARWAADVVRQWYGEERKTRFDERLLVGRGDGAVLRGLAADTDAPAIIRATALSLLPPLAAALPVVEVGLVDESPLVRGAALAALEGADPVTVTRLALPLLADADRSVRLEAARLLAAIPRPQVPPRQRPLLDQALDEYRAAQAENSDRAEAHINLGVLATQQGDLTTAEGAYQEALDLEPYFVPAYVNLADLYRLMGRDREGEAYLRQALDIAPESGEIRHALGLLLVRTERLGEAVEALRRAAALSPGQPRYVYVYAVAVQTAGDMSGARAILASGLEVFPDDLELLFAAAAFSRDAGDFPAAIGYAERLVAAAPEDAEAAAFLRQLQGR